MKIYMEILCSVDLMNENINIVSKAVSARSTMPVLEGIYICAGADGKMVLKANDMELCIETDMEADVITPGEAVINAKLLGNIMKSLKSEKAHITVTEGCVSIKGGKARFELPLISAAEFPDIAKPENGSSVRINKSILKEMINKTIFAVATIDTRPVLMGCLLEIKGKNLRMVAVDGYRMALRNATLDEEFEDNRIIIPTKALNELTKILKDDDEYVNISWSGNHALFEFDGCRMYTRLIEGEYINYESIINIDAPEEIECCKEELFDAVQRAALVLAGENGKSIKMRIEENNINISCESSFGSVDDNIEVENYGFELTIGFNHRYLIDALKSCDCETVKLKIKASRNPIIIEPTEGNEFLYLVLPVRLNEE